eukprot:763858-Hanusia_phi.AAC.5
MGWTDWKCSVCGNRGHRKSSNPNKCSKGVDRMLDWGSTMTCCVCRSLENNSVEKCPQCADRWARLEKEKQERIKAVHGQTYHDI